MHFSPPAHSPLDLPIHHNPMHPCFKSKQACTPDAVLVGATRAPAAWLTQRRAVTEQKAGRAGAVQSSVVSCFAKNQGGVCSTGGRMQARGWAEERSATRAADWRWLEIKAGSVGTQVCRLRFGHNTRTRRQGRRGREGGTGRSAGRWPRAAPTGPGRPAAQQRIFLGTNRSCMDGSGVRVRGVGGCRKRGREGVPSTWWAHARVLRWTHTAHAWGHCARRPCKCRRKLTGCLTEC